MSKEVKEIAIIVAGSVVFIAYMALLGVFVVCSWIGVCSKFKVDPIQSMIDRITSSVDKKLDCKSTEYGLFFISLPLILILVGLAVHFIRDHCKKNPTIENENNPRNRTSSLSPSGQPELASVVDPATVAVYVPHNE